MDKQKLIMSLAETQGDQVLLARVWDRISIGIRKNIPAATCFLSGREQLLAKRMLCQGGLEEPVFFGGIANAERCVAAFIPEYYEPEVYLQSEEGPVAAIRIIYSDYDNLNHRDFLGSLMSQGIKREVLGDLLPQTNSCDVLVLREMAPYLSLQLTHVGHTKVQTRQISLSEVQVPEQKVKRIADTVASLRLDSVIASGFQLGRSKAAAYVHAGKAEVNHMTTIKPDTQVVEGDIISVRGLGRLRVSEVKGQTKKGRIALVLEKYL